jgi:hypothetical protein
MKKQLFIMICTLAVTAILLLSGVAVNHHSNPTPGSHWMADGVPLPPPTQPPPDLQMADGVPLPPPTQPPPDFNVVLTADGVPLPPPTQPPPDLAAI